MANLLTTLEMIAHCKTPVPTRELEDFCGVSSRHLKRLIDDAKHLGADMKPVREGGAHCWITANWGDLEKAGLVQKWIDLERGQTLLTKRKR